MLVGGQGCPQFSLLFKGNSQSSGTKTNQQEEVWKILERGGTDSQRYTRHSGPQA
jgi:hypothetical protein